MARGWGTKGTPTGAEAEAEAEEVAVAEGAEEEAAAGDESEGEEAGAGSEAGTADSGALWATGVLSISIGVVTDEFSCVEIFEGSEDAEAGAEKVTEGEEEVRSTEAAEFVGASIAAVNGMCG
jgi:hypothetical protein